jgi:DNA-binding beta-propeller fold protein YncE
VRSWTQKGFDDDKLYDPVGLELLPDGGAAAADYTTGRIAAVYADGTVRRLFAHADVGGQPYMVRLAPDGKAWVCSHLAGLQVFAGEADARGQTLLPEHDWYPIDVVFRDGEALVTDFRNDKILVFDAKTTRWKRTIPLGSLAEARAPHGLAFHGHALVATCHDSNTLVALPDLGRDLDRAAVLDLAGFAMEHPCYLLVDAGRAYVTSSTLGGMTALDISGWPGEEEVTRKDEK